MTAVKERIIGAVSLMSDKEAEVFWRLIQNRYTVSPKGWEDIDEEAPDDIDLRMLEEIKKDPDCHTFLSSEEALKELGL